MRWVETSRLSVGELGAIQGNMASFLGEGKASLGDTPSEAGSQLAGRFRAIGCSDGSEPLSSIGGVQ